MNLILPKGKNFRQIEMGTHYPFEYQLKSNLLRALHHVIIARAPCWKSQTSMHRIPESAHIATLDKTIQIHVRHT